MKRFILNSTDLEVSALCFGQAYVGTGFYTEEISCRLLDVFFDAGGNFIDTARVYTNWVPGELHRSERIIGDYMKRSGRRDKFVISSKGCHYDLDTKENRVSGKIFLEEIDGSLKTLKTDYIDLYFFHRDNVNIPVEELLEAGEIARKAGKIRYYGVSNWTVPRIVEARNVAAEENIQGFSVNQITMNPGIDVRPLPPDDTITLWGKEYADYHRMTGQPVMAAASMSNGVFSMYANPELRSKVAEECKNPAFVARAEHIMDLSRKTGLSASQLCLRYVTDYPGFQAIPLFTATCEEYLTEALGAFDHDLPENAFDWC